MKNILITLCLIISFSCKSQIVSNYQIPNTLDIIPVEQIVDEFIINPEENVHIKDVNHIFDNYIGNWTASINAKDYTFIITKETILFDAYDNIYLDVLLIRYLILDSNNLAIIEDSTDSSYESVPIEGSIFRNLSNGLNYELHYTGMQEDKVACGQNGNVYIKLTNNNTQLYFNLSDDHNMYDECPNGLAEQVLPINRILLTKQ